MGLIDLLPFLGPASGFLIDLPRIEQASERDIQRDELARDELDRLGGRISNLFNTPLSGTQFQFGNQIFGGGSVPGQGGQSGRVPVDEFSGKGGQSGRVPVDEFSGNRGFKGTAPQDSIFNLDEAVGQGSESLSNFLDEFDPTGGLDQFRFDPSSGQNAIASIQSQLGQSRLQPGQLAQQVDFPDIDSRDFLNAQLSNISQGSQARTQQQRQQLLSSGQPLSNIDPALTGLEFSEARGRAGQTAQARSRARESELERGFQQAGIQAQLAGQEASVNQALAQALAATTSDITRANIAAQASNLDTLARRQLGGLQLEADLEESLADQFGFESELGLSGLTNLLGLQQRDRESLGNLLAAIGSQRANILTGESESIPLFSNILSPVAQLYFQQQQVDALRDQANSGIFG